MASPQDELDLGGEDVKRNKVGEACMDASRWPTTVESLERNRATCRNHFGITLELFDRFTACRPKIPSGLF